MPRIYELLGFPVDDNSPAVVEYRRNIYIALSLEIHATVEGIAICRTST